MIGQPIPAPRDLILAELNASIDSFFAQGGQVEQVPGYTPVPRRPHRDLEVIRATEDKPENPKARRRREQLAMLRNLAKTMTYREAAEATGLAQTTLYRASVEGCFCFRADPKRFQGAEGRIYKNEAKDKIMADRIVEMLTLGLSRHQAQKQLEISDTKFKRIIQDFGIDYPKAAGKRCDGSI